MTQLEKEIARRFFCFVLFYFSFLAGGWGRGEGRGGVGWGGGGGGRFEFKTLLNVHSGTIRRISGLENEETEAGNRDYGKLGGMDGKVRMV